MSDDHRIDQIFPAQPGWRLVVQDTQCEGALFLDVACWALVAFGDRRRVVPMFAPPYENAGALAVLPPDDAVVGLAAPGDDPRTWEEQAKMLRDAARSKEEREEQRSLASRVAGRLTQSDIDLLRAMRLDPASAIRHVASSAGIVVLAEHGLLETYRIGDEVRREWGLSTLGRAVLEEVERRSR